MKEEFNRRFFDLTLERIEEVLDMLVSIDMNIAIYAYEKDVEFYEFNNGKEIMAFCRYLKVLEKELSEHKEKRDGTNIKCCV